VLSGGEKSRLALLKILLQDSNLLILDEPTNHLDLKTKEIFQNALLGYTGTVVIVSHDRFFLDHLVSRVIEIRDGRCYEYLGNYSYFIQKRGEMTSAISGTAGERPFQTEANEAMPGRRPFKTKEEKRLEAEERNRLSSIMSAFKTKLKALENHIIHLEEKKVDNEKILCEPGIHREPQKIKMLNQELLDITRELENLYASWDTLTQKIEAHETGNSVS